MYDIIYLASGGGRALGSHSRGQGFESPYLHQKELHSCGNRLAKESAHLSGDSKATVKKTVRWTVFREKTDETFLSSLNPSCEMDRFALSNAPYLHQKCRSQNCGATLTKLNIISWGYSSAGRVLDWQSRGHGFEPRYLHHFILLRKWLWSAIFGASLFA